MITGINQGTGSLYMVHDQFTDRSFRVLAKKLANFQPAAKELVKTAEVSYEAADDLPDDAYAWPEMRKFAMHTPEHTALSCIYAHGEKLPKHVKERLEKAASLYGLDEHMQPVDLSPPPRLAHISDYLIPQTRTGLITKEAHVKEAAEYLANNYKKLDLETRAHAAATLVKKARVFGRTVSPTFYKHAGLTKSNPRILQEWLEVRSNLSQNPTIKEGFSKLAEFVGDKTKFAKGSRNEMLKLAQTIYELDQKENLHKKYDITLPDPLLTVFNTNKVASATITLASKEIPLSDLLAIDPETYAGILGEDIKSEISDGENLKESELIDILTTLPSDLQSLLVSTLGL